MADINKIREEIEALDAAARALNETEDGELREFTPEEQTAYDENRSERATKYALLQRHLEIENAAAVPAKVERSAPSVTPATRDALDVVEDRSASPKQLADAVLRELEDKVEDTRNQEHVARVLKTHARDKEWARGILVRSTDLYASAWLKCISGREYTLTDEERTVLGVTTNANGKFLLPTHLDPTIIVSNAGTANVLRGLARQVTLTDGAKQWNGITSGGVTASWDGEVVEVSDDSPTFGNPVIDTHRAQALVQASISAVEDISGLGSDVLAMFADARDRLEATAHMSGSGTGQPKGIFTALQAVAGAQVQSATAGAIAVEDLHNVYRSVPQRYRANGAWVMNPLYALAIKALGTAVSASFTTDLTAGSTGTLLAKPVVESDDAPTTQTTTALDPELIYGDFSQYVIVDRPGDMSVEYIPHLFNTTTNLPDGRRAWYATWRHGADATLTSEAFRLLVDKTSL
jgi:HK97 family phage major capsid protein